VICFVSQGVGWASVKDADLRSQVEVAKFSPRWRLLMMAQIVNNYLLGGQGLFTCWPRIVYLLVKACLLVDQELFTYWSRHVYLLAKDYLFIGQGLFTCWPRLSTS
jgi:hypothetical protein